MKTSMRRLTHSRARSTRTPIFFGGVLLTIAIAACSSAGTPGGDLPAADRATPATITASAATPGHQQLAGHLTDAMKTAHVVSRVEPEKALTVTVGLPVKDAAALQKAVDEVSDPTSASYRKYLTPEAFADRHGASAADYQKVLDWAKARGFAVTANANRLVADVTGPVADLEAALHVRMHYRLRADGTAFYAPDREPSLDLDVPVAHVSNLDNYVLPRSASGSGPGGSRQGSDFRNAYASCTSLRGTGQTVGILMLDGFSQSDVNAYFASMAMPPPRPIQTVPAGSGTTVGVEGNLDVQMALSMAPDAQVVAFTGSVNTILSNVASRPSVKQLSSSWFTVIDSNAMNLIAQMALQGQSFLQASGDSGALQPGYFSSTADFRIQPTVTLVGGTSLSMNGTGSSYGTESAWPGSSGGILSFSGGGGAAIPPYQVGLATTANQASSTYRNMPDVSAEASYVNIYVNGAPYQVGGTSAATPLWAGFMALVNQQAAAVGQGSIGFANPAMYSLARSAYATDFNDITTGSTATSAASYSATPGYDLSTGLGSPKCALINALAGSKRTSDIVWRNTGTGDVELWRMKNGAPSAYTELAAADSTWVIQGTGDFNGDGTGDLLWRNTTSGYTSIWQLHDAVITAHLDPGGATPDWSIQGTGDFNGDGTSDILWRNASNGQVEIWQMKNGAVSAYIVPSSAVADWVIQGTGDFNGDGTSDILWRQTSTGAVAIWLIKNGAITAYKDPGSATSDWTIRGVGDFNGDGTSDILWRNANGQVEIWQINNGAPSAYLVPSSAVADWVIQGTGDFNDDGTSDILWRQTSTGNVSIWQMAKGAINAYLDPGSAIPAWVIRGTITD